MSAGRARASRGFTLLEITVTLAILGLVLSIVYGVFARALSSKDLAEGRADRAAAVRSALASMTRDLTLARPRGGVGSAPAPAAGSSRAPTPPPRTALFPPRQGLFLGRLRAAGDAALHDLAFSAFLRRPTAITFGATDLGVVHYFVSPLGEDADRLGLYREALFSLTGDAFDPDEAHVESTTLVLPDVLGLDLRFFDGRDWGPEWDSTDPRRFAPAPLAVEITLTVGDERGRPATYRTAIDLPMAAPAAPRLAAPPGGAR
ncbi:MAG: prepilin-type N-terminal cleavage/methylation domain-containing protein [Deltaproteobacteria bacterium]|nr:prepilin-type N-terminal cleavage/methylation domain-containing protein [Deltaproteobacteria bacterium]